MAHRARTARRPDDRIRRIRLSATNRHRTRRRNPIILGRLSATNVLSEGNSPMTNTTVTELIARSNRLGSDRKNTNYAGGNTSVKGTDTDPVTGKPVDLLWVKGSGGDLGTLTESGLAVLRLDRM